MGVGPRGRQAVRRQDGVLHADVAVRLEDGVAQRLGAAVLPDLALEVADPQHQVGDGGGARIHFEADELGGRHGHAFEFEGGAAIPRQRLPHFAFQPFQVVERDVKKVARAARRVEHLHARQPGQKARQLALRFKGGALLRHGRRLCLGPRLDSRHGRLHRLPLGLQRLDDGRPHEALDVRARRVVGAQVVPLGGVEGAFEKGSENGRLDALPVLPRRREQLGEGVGRKREGRRVVEQAAVEAAQAGAQLGGVAARVHGLPQRGEAVGQHVERVAVAFEQARKSALGQQAGVFGKHRKQAARQKAEHGVGRVAVLFEGRRHARQPGSQGARDAGLVPRGVEAVRVGKNAPQPVAHVVVVEGRQGKALLPRRGKRFVEPPLPREVGKQVERVAHIYDDEKGRHGLAFAQVAGVAGGLLPGGHEGALPRARAAHAVARALPGGFGVGALLGFEDEVAAPVQVYAAQRGVGRVAEADAFLEHEGVVVGASRRGPGPLDAQHVAEFGQEKLVVGALGGLRGLPAGNESSNGSDGGRGDGGGLQSMLREGEIGGWRLAVGGWRLEVGGGRVGDLPRRAGARIRGGAGHGVLACRAAGVCAPLRAQ